ncbi:hypothetical protein HMPREF0995_03069 [Lachnospiraceae bacterium 7_1_58FAA]|nr:hypothetical protein HMPREF0995_03069 [Lachnospiraceae bacterium 7_1_58FAA]
MKIIVDAMGGDNAPVSNVRGALAAVRELGVEVILVGRGEDILKVLKEDGIGELPPGLEIVHASEVVEMCDNPATAFKEKKDSSLTVGLNLLKNGDGAAFVSAGSTGALLSAATLMVKRIRGIRRAAMAPGGAYRRRRRGAHRLRRHGGGYAGVSAPVRLYGLLLRRAGAQAP